MNKFWQVRNAANGAGEILLYGSIASEKSWWGDEVTPQEFAADLESLGGRAVTVRINSAGGDVFAAHAIHNQLAAYAGPVTVIIDGLAASAATIVAMAGDKIIMPSNALFMIHNPAIGLNDYYEADELTKVVDALAVIKSSIVAAYQKRCRISQEELTAMMDAETWMGAAECLEKGFVDEIQGAVPAVLNGVNLIINQAAYDITQFKNAEALRRCVRYVNSPIERKKPMSKLKEFLNSIGLDINEEALTAAAQNSAPVSTEQVAAVNAEEAARLAVEAERKRVSDLDALDSGENQAVTAIIAAAKKNGKTVDDVMPYVTAVKNVQQAAANPAAKLVENLIKDAQNSGAEQIQAGGTEPGELEKAKDAASISHMVDVMNTKFKGGRN